MGRCTGLPFKKAQNTQSQIPTARRGKCAKAGTGRSATMEFQKVQIARVSKGPITPDANQMIQCSAAVPILLQPHSDSPEGHQHQGVLDFGAFKRSHLALSLFLGIIVSDQKVLTITLLSRVGLALRPRPRSNRGTHGHHCARAVRYASPIQNLRSDLLIIFVRSHWFAPAVQVTGNCTRQQ